MTYDRINIIRGLILGVVALIITDSWIAGAAVIALLVAAFVLTDEVRR